MEHKKGILKLSPGMGADETLEAKLQVCFLVSLRFWACACRICMAVCWTIGCTDGARGSQGSHLHFWGLWVASQQSIACATAKWLLAADQCSVNNTDSAGCKPLTP
jgi:hypothetical protein